MGKETESTNPVVEKTPEQNPETTTQKKAEAETKAKAETTKKTSAKKVYKLKKEFEGTLWKGNVLRSDLLTSKLVTDLKKNHPKGTSIFQK